MPLLRIVTSVKGAERENALLLSELSRFVAEKLRKPESYVMTSLVTNAMMTFAGNTEPVCSVELKNIGSFTPKETRDLSAEICKRLEAALGVSAKRIYIEFTNAQGHLWGHDGETFG
jgi:phenylpyruvate tautomerase